MTIATFVNFLLYICTIYILKKYALVIKTCIYFEFACLMVFPHETMKIGYNNHVPRKMQRLYLWFCPNNGVLKHSTIYWKWQYPYMNLLKGFSVKPSVKLHIQKQYNYSLVKWNKESTKLQRPNILFASFLPMSRNNPFDWHDSATF